MADNGNVIYADFTKPTKEQLTGEELVERIINIAKEYAVDKDDGYIHKYSIGNVEVRLFYSDLDYSELEQEIINRGTDYGPIAFIGWLHGLLDSYPEYSISQLQTLNKLIILVSCIIESKNIHILSTKKEVKSIGDAEELIYINDIRTEAGHVLHFTLRYKQKV